MLQSLFTWIFYLFKSAIGGIISKVKASILIHLDFLSICDNYKLYSQWIYASILIHLDFLSIYTIEFRVFRGSMASILIHLDFLSIWLIIEPVRLRLNASILIHLDFLSIWKIGYKFVRRKECFNPYSPGFSIYFTRDYNAGTEGWKLQSLFTWIFYLFLCLRLIMTLHLLASILIHLDFLSIFDKKIR